MDACQAVLDNQKIIIAVCGVAYMGLEAYMGKSQKFEAGSILEAVYNLFKKKSQQPQDPEKKDDQAL